MTDISTLSNTLAAYGQADEDGIMCIVSRQAVEELLDLIRSGAVVEAGWRTDMENAPKDGEVVLLLTKMHDMYVGSWRLGHIGEPQWEREPEHWRCSSSGRWANPIAWHPLPTPPTDTEAEG
jgi:hypothetical protein